MSHEALLRSLPIGKRMWLRAGGTSLWPLVPSGAQLQVERATVDQLRVGHIAVVAWPNGTLVAHLVRQVDPLLTVTSLGLDDPPGCELLGRVVAVKQGELRVPVPSSSAVLLRWVPRTARLLRAVVRRIR
ncbi:MAG: hypothetical protein JNG84_01270 [Archangium sp.]|nr:hypothetical protein [Archangium sp.]